MKPTDREFPKRGWKCCRVVDLQARQGIFYEPGSCDLCGRQLRFVHVMENPKYADCLRVGVDCAANLEGDPQAPLEREKRLKSLARRRTGFVSRAWKKSGNGNPCLKIGGYIVTIFKNTRGPGSCYSIARKGEAPEYGNRYATVEDAQLGAFDRLAEILEW